MSKMSVLLGPEEEERFAAYCREKGFKKSTLVARLIREHLDREGFASQRALPLGEKPRKASRQSVPGGRHRA